MTTPILTILLIVANVMGAGMIVPQVVRLHRLRSTDGLSGAWVGVGIAMNSWWTAYGIAESLWGILPVSIVAALLYVVMAVQYLGLLGRVGIRPLAIGALGLGLLPMPFLLLGGWEAAGVVVGLSYAVQFTPAALAATREAELSGVSPTTWVMAWIEAVIWVIYGVTTSDVALLIGGTGGTVASTVILGQIGRYRRRAGNPQADAATPPPNQVRTGGRCGGSHGR